MATTNEVLSNHSAAIRNMTAANARRDAALNAILADLAVLKSRPVSVSEAIDAIPGRRLETILSGEVAFDETLEQRNGPPIYIPISQDGPFIQTHYPLLLWYPTEPSNTDNLGAWRPVSSWPMPTQEIQGDYLDLKYSVFDSGSQRDLQNEARGPILSRPDNIVPMACPTQWAPNAQVRITPYYQRISFTGNTAAEAPVPPTAGTLYCALIGYRIVNL